MCSWWWWCAGGSAGGMLCWTLPQLFYVQAAGVKSLKKYAVDMQKPCNLQKQNIIKRRHHTNTDTGTVLPVGGVGALWAGGRAEQTPLSPGACSCWTRRSEKQGYNRYQYHFLRNLCLHRWSGHTTGTVHFCINPMDPYLNLLMAGTCSKLKSFSNKFLIGFNGKLIQKKG